MSKKLAVESLIKTEAEFDAQHNPLHEGVSALNVYAGKAVAKGTQRYLFTSAQNATPVMANGWAALLQYKEFWDAHLDVIPFRYKNPTSKWTGSQENKEYWVEAVRPYLNNNRWAVNANLTVLGDIKIVPTAKDPLQGHEGFTGAESSIIGHPNLAFKTVPVPGHMMAKLMTTTGAITLNNYSDSRAGKQGEFQHVFGAVVVEVEGGKFWMRHLNMNSSGEFMDVAEGVTRLYTKDGVFEGPQVEALVTGDAHVRLMDPAVDKAVFGLKNSIMACLKPKRCIWHDVYDGFTSSPWDKKQPFEFLAKMKKGLDVVEDELNETANFVLDRTPEGCEAVIVESNHNEFLRRWLEDNTWQSVGLNGGVYLELAKHVWDGTHLKEDNVAHVPNPFSYWMQKVATTVGFKGKVRCLSTDESYSVKGIELGMHGHRGPNGARGSLFNLVKIGVKFVIGHVHGPGIKFGGYAVGLMARLRHGYNKGPSNWLQTMCLVHGDPCGGKRQLITIIDGRPWL